MLKVPDANHGQQKNHVHEPESYVLLKTAHFWLASLGRICRYKNVQFLIPTDENSWSGCRVAGLSSGCRKMDDVEVTSNASMAQS